MNEGQYGWGYQNGSLNFTKGVYNLTIIYTVMKLAPLPVGENENWGAF
jgi:hypothetical protein